MKCLTVLIVDVSIPSFYSFNFATYMYTTDIEQIHMCICYEYI